MIERKIIIGCIVSTEYLKQVREIWNKTYIESNTARLLSSWCIEYFDKFKKAPALDIEQIYFSKIKDGIEETVAEEIEEDILPDLNEEYLKQDINVEFLVEETLHYFEERRIRLLAEQTEGTLDSNIGTSKKRLKDAKEILQNSKPVELIKDDTLDLSQEEYLNDALDRAFSTILKPVITFPKQLGEYWDDQFYASAFIAFLATEKKGKSWILIQIALQALRQKKNVAFFQAGDMSEGAFLKRIAINLSKQNTSEKYCQEHWEPVRDCKLNQQDKCSNKKRQCNFGIFDDMDLDEINKLKLVDYIQIAEEIPEYEPCFNCSDYDRLKLGAPYVRKVKEKIPLDVNKAKKIVNAYLKKHKKSFKVSTHATKTLTFTKVRNLLDKWYEKEGFVPDVIIFDYLDIMLSEKKTEVRHQENDKWESARTLAQTERDGVLPIVCTVTQADGKAYKAYRLSLDNYSEDKRKYGHVTAMYGLNQDPSGREKSLGLLRINELIKREGEFAEDNEITLLQNLRQGRPMKQSYFN